MSGITLTVPEVAIVKQLRDIGTEEDTIATIIMAKRKKAGAGPAPAPIAPPATPPPAAAQAPIPTSVAQKLPPAQPAPKRRGQPPAAPVVPSEGQQLSDEQYAEQVAAEGNDPEPLQFAPVLPPAMHTTGALQVVGQMPQSDYEYDGPAMPIAYRRGDKLATASGGQVSGSWSSQDSKIPFLVLVQGSGENAKKFGSGRTVLMDMQLFDTPTESNKPTFRFCPVAIQRYFRQQLPKDAKGNTITKDAQGNDIVPKNWNTAEEAEADGYTTEWTTGPNGERIQPSAQPAARLALLIEKPANANHPGFAMEIPDNEGNIHYYALAATFLHGATFRRTAVPIKTACDWILREGKKIALSKRMWEMTVTTEQVGNFNPYIFAAKMLNENAPDMLRQVAENIGASQG